MKNKTCSTCEHWEGDSKEKECFRVCGILFIDGNGQLVRNEDAWATSEYLRTRDTFPACGYWKERATGPFFWSPTETGGLIFIRSQASSLAVSDKTEGEAITNWLNDMWEKLKGRE